MKFFLLAKVPWVLNIVAVLWILIAIALILMILLQKGKGGGLGAAFGGMGAQSLLGTKTGDFFTWVTIFLVAMFLGLGMVMVKWYKPIAAGSGLRPDTQVQTQTTDQEAGVPEAVDMVEDKVPDADALAPQVAPEQVPPAEAEDQNPQQ